MTDSNSLVGSQNSHISFAVEEFKRDNDHDGEALEIDGSQEVRGGYSLTSSPFDLLCLLLLMKSSLFSTDLHTT